MMSLGMEGITNLLLFIVKLLATRLGFSTFLLLMTGLLHYDTLYYCPGPGTAFLSIVLKRYDRDVNTEWNR